MSAARLRREGERFILTWQDEQVGIGFDRVQDTRDGVTAEITVESLAPPAVGTVHGPVRLNLLSTQSQNGLARLLGERVNGCDWQSIVAEGCAVVVAGHRTPPPPVDLSDGTEVGAVELLLPGIPRGETTVLYGDGESAKSLSGLLIALAARSGLELPWGVQVEPIVNVMVLDWETTEQTVRSRLQRIVRGYELDPPQIHYRELHQPLIDVVEQLRVDRDRYDIGLFVVDSLSFACAGSLNDDEAARGAMNALRRLSPATRLCVAHLSQDSARATKGPVKPFGSAFFWNGMRSGWEIRRAEESPPNIIDLGFYHRKSNDGQRQRPFALSVRFDGQDGPITFSRGDLSDSPDLIGRTSLSTRIRAALRAGAMNTVQLAEEVDASEATVRSAVRKMPDVVQLNPGSGRGNPSTWGLSS